MSDGTIITYCYTGQVATTLLGLLGHDAHNMKFGMMGWNANFMGGVAPFDCAPPDYVALSGPDPW